MKNKLISISVSLMLIFSSLIFVEAAAPSPRVDLNEYEVTTTDINNVYVSGIVNMCVGQNIALFDSTGKVPLNYTTVENTGSQGSFKIKVPPVFLQEGTNTFKVISLPVRGKANASSPKTFTVKVKATSTKKNQTITASNITVNVNSSTNINAKVDSGLPLTYWSKNPDIATVNANGTVYGNKVGSTSVTINQAGNNDYNPASKVVNITVKDNTPTKPTKPTTYKIVYHGGSGIGAPVSGSMSTQVITKNKTVKLSKNKFKKKDYVFVGWATADKRASKNGSTYIENFSNINMEHFQLGCVKQVRKPSAVGNGKNWSQLKDKEKQYLTDQCSVKNLAKPGETLHLYAVWKGCGPQAAVDWGTIIAKDNNFNYGEKYQSNWRGTGNDRAHRVGCYFCGTNRNQPNRKYRGKAAKKWDKSKSFSKQSIDQKYDKTYCCNPFVVACYTHGANEYEKCHGGNMSYSSWTCHNGKGTFKKSSRSTSKLEPGDVFFSGGHVWMYAGKIKGKDGKYHRYILEASKSTWDANSIHLEKDNTPASGANGAVRYTKKKGAKYSIINKSKN